MDEIKKAEQLLLKQADRERKAHMSTTEYAMELAGAFHEEMVQAHALTLDSVQTVIKTTDGKGNIHTSVLRGLMSSVPTEGSSVAYSNMRSRRERANRIRQIIGEVDGIIDALKKGRSSPDDLKAHLAELKATIPNRNELELIGKPKGGK